MQRQLKFRAWDKREKMNTYPRPNGIACPKCGKEMMDSDCMVLYSNPPQKNVECECGYRDYRIA